MSGHHEYTSFPSYDFGERTPSDAVKKQYQEEKLSLWVSFHQANGRPQQESTRWAFDEGHPAHSQQRRDVHGVSSCCSWEMYGDAEDNPTYPPRDNIIETFGKKAKMILTDHPLSVSGI